MEYTMLTRFESYAAGLQEDNQGILCLKGREAPLYQVSMATAMGDGAPSLKLGQATDVDKM